MCGQTKLSNHRKAICMYTCINNTDLVLCAAAVTTAANEYQPIDAGDESWRIVCPAADKWRLLHIKRTVVSLAALTVGILSVASMCNVDLYYWSCVNISLATGLNVRRNPHDIPLQLTNTSQRRWVSLRTPNDMHFPDSMRCECVKYLGLLVRLSGHRSSMCRASSVCGVMSRDKGGAPAAPCLHQRYSTIIVDRDTTWIDRNRCGDHESYWLILQLRSQQPQHSYGRLTRNVKLDKDLSYCLFLPSSQFWRTQPLMHKHIITLTF